MKGKKWQCYYGGGLMNVLIEHSTPTNVCLFLLLSLRLMKESRLQHCTQVLEKVRPSPQPDRNSFTPA